MSINIVWNVCLSSTDSLIFSGFILCIPASSIHRTPMGRHRVMAAAAIRNIIAIPTCFIYLAIYGFMNLIISIFFFIFLLFIMFLLFI